MHILRFAEAGVQLDPQSLMVSEDGDEGCQFVYHTWHDKGMTGHAVSAGSVAAHCCGCT